VTDVKRPYILHMGDEVEGTAEPSASAIPLYSKNVSYSTSPAPLLTLTKFKRALGEQGTMIVVSMGFKVG
jgi:hypothetical protein